MDKGIEHQQNLSKYAIGVVLISARSNRIQDIQPAMLKVNVISRYCLESTSTNSRPTQIADVHWIPI